MAIYKIGEAARRLGISVRTLRYYEEEGLITPVRSGGGTRLYEEAHVERLRGILDLAESHFPLGRIRDLCTAREGHGTGAQSSREVHAELEGIADDLQRRINAMQRLMGEVRAAQQIIGGCSNCPNPPTNAGCPECPVRQRLDDVRLLRLIWEPA